MFIVCETHSNQHIRSYHFPYALATEGIGDVFWRSHAQVPLKTNLAPDYFGVNDKLHRLCRLLKETKIEVDCADMGSTTKTNDRLDIKLGVHREADWMTIQRCISAAFGLSVEPLTAAS